MPPKAILSSCSHQTLVSHSFQFSLLGPYSVIYCAPFTVHFVLLLSNSDKQRAVVWVIPHILTHTCTHPRAHPTCALGILGNAQIDGQNVFLFYGQERNIKVNWFCLGELLASLLMWGIWDFYLLVHGLCMFRLCDCPFIIPEEDDGSPKGPLCLSFYNDMRSFQISLALKFSSKPQHSWDILYTTLLIEFVLTGFRSPVMCPAFIQCPQKAWLLSPQELLFSLLHSQS